MTTQGFTPVQVTQLLKPISSRRVLRDPKGHSHVSQQDVTAHLIRVFGFGAFDTEIVSVECVFESERVKPDGTVLGSTDKNGAFLSRWDVCYRALLRLTIRDPQGRSVAHYEDGSTATAQNQTRGDGHDLAYKSALSLAKKRAAINLGDQFGLSLYNKGQTDALVIGTLVHPDAEPGTAAQDMQAEVAQQVSLGNDEIDHEPAEANPPATTARPSYQRQVKQSDIDKVRNPADPDVERQTRLAEGKVRRDVMGVDSRGRVNDGTTVQRGPLADDPWAAS